MDKLNRDVKITSYYGSPVIKKGTEIDIHEEADGYVCFSLIRDKKWFAVDCSNLPYGFCTAKKMERDDLNPVIGMRQEMFDDFIRENGPSEINSFKYEK